MANRTMSDERALSQTWGAVYTEWSGWANGSIVTYLLAVASVVIAAVSAFDKVPWTVPVALAIFTVIFGAVSLALGAFRVAHKERLSLIDARARVIGQIIRFENLNAADMPDLRMASDSGLRELLGSFLSHGVIHAALIQIETSGLRRTRASDWAFSLRQVDGAQAECTATPYDWDAPRSWPKNLTYCYLRDVDGVLLEKDARYNIVLFVGVRHATPAAGFDLSSFEASFKDEAGETVACAMRRTA